MASEAEQTKAVLERRSIGTPERMILPPGVQAGIIEYRDQVKGLDVTTEVVTALISIGGGRTYLVEAGTSNGGRKKPDEDFVCIKTYSLPGSELTSLLWLGVKDGMGGQGMGHRASEIAARAADDYLTRLSHSRDLWNQLKDESPAEQERVNLAHKQQGKSGTPEQVTIELMLMKKIMEIQDRAIIEYNQQNGTSSGATSVDVFIFPETERLVEGHAGDSRYYHQKAGEKPFRSTIDHNVAESLRTAGVEANREQKSQVFRALGGGLHAFTRLARFMNVGDNAFESCDGFADSLGDQSGGQLDQSGKPVNQSDWLMSASMAKVLTADPSEDHAKWVMQQAQTNATDNLSFVRVKRIR